MNLAQRLLLGSLVVIAALVAADIFLVGRRVSRRALTNATVQLTREAKLIALMWTTDAEPERLAPSTAAATGRRVTLINNEGNVVGDSEFGGNALTLLGNLRSLADVAAAVDSGRSATHVSDDAGRRLLHLSVPAALGAVRLTIPMRQIGAVGAGVRSDLLISGSIAAVLALILAALFARSISRPIVELRDVTRMLASGDLTKRPPISAPGEVGELSLTVHTLSEQLSARLGALRAEESLLSATIDSLNEGVIAVDMRRNVVLINKAGRSLLRLEVATPFSTDLLPRDRALREALAEAVSGRNVSGAEIDFESRRLSLTARPLAGGGAVLALFDLTQLRRLENVRKDFVANVSHELRTPLTIISGFAETLLEGDLPDDKRLLFADHIRKHAARMQRLVDDLLDLSLIESGRWTPHFVPVDLRLLLRDLTSELESAAERKGITLTYDVDEAVLPISADAMAMRQILTNLVDNAIRYTSAGSVAVRVGGDATAVAVTVSDTGIGMLAEHLPRIFERFYRVDSARSREYGGTGLGLSIVRHLVEAHAGKITVTSTPGAGSTFTVLLPRNSGPARDTFVAKPLSN